jgi:hypothetical protein
MSTTYPIIDRRPLSLAEKARWFSKKTRKPEELPRPAAHQTLVYRVGGEYLLDNDRLTAVDERIVNATNVCVVDMRRNAPVVVKLEIPSADASYFEILVTFMCSVKDPITVVRGGVDAYEALWGHLKAHNKIFELGLGYPLSEVNEVRRVVGAQVKAYLTIKPPTVSGMLVSFANVEVGSPKDLIEFKKKHRDKDFEQQLAWQERDYLHRREAGQAQHSQSMEGVALHHEQQLDGRRHNHVRQVQTDDTEQELYLQQRRSAVGRSEFELNMSMIDNDPRRALMAAFANGRIDAAGLAQQLRELDDRDREALVREAEGQRNARMELMAAGREERKLDQDWEREKSEREREDRRRQDQQAQEDRIREEAQDREDRLLKEKNEREDRTRADQERREDEWRRYDNEVNVLKQMAAQGHLSTSNVGADRLFAKVMRMPQPEVGTADAPPVGTKHAVPELEAEEDTSRGVREEDE